MDHALSLLTTCLAAVGAGFAAYHAYRTGGRLEAYRLEINSRMDQFIEVIKKAAFAEGEKAQKAALELDITQTAAVKLDEAAHRAAEKLDDAAERAAALLRKGPG